MQILLHSRLIQKKTDQQFLGKNFNFYRYEKSPKFPAGHKIWTGIYGLASILGGTRRKKLREIILEIPSKRVEQTQNR